MSSEKQTVRKRFITAITDAPIVVPSDGNHQLRVIGIEIMPAKGNSNNASVSIGFGAPLGEDLISAHPGLTAGSGIIEEDVDISGGANEGVYFTCSDPGGTIDVVVKYREIRNL